MLNKLLYKRLVYIVLLCLVSINSISCSKPKETISIYGLIADNSYIRLLVNLYNKSQKKINVTYKNITEVQLRYVLENTMQRKNLYLLLTNQIIVAKAGLKEYLEPMLPAYSAEIREFQFNDLGKNTIKLTRNFGFPLYIYDVNNILNVNIATLTIPKKGFKPEQIDILKDFLQFCSQAAINARAYNYNFIPIYDDALLSLLSQNEQNLVRSLVFPSNMFNNNFQPLKGGLSIAK